MKEFKILVLNGPNLNMLGIREPAYYGNETLDSIKKECCSVADNLGIDLEFKQSNHEGDLVTWIQDAYGKFDGIVINPAAYTHTSVAILDALLAVSLPIVEVHLSNIHKRDEFRHSSYVSKVADCVICGAGGYGYELALNAVCNVIRKRRNYGKSK